MKVEKEDVLFQGLVTFINLFRVPTDKLKAIATPDVSNREVWKASGSVITITNFLGGADGQQISIRGDGTTSIANNSNIVTNTGAAVLLAVDLIYRFTYYNSDKKWCMDK